MTIQRITAVLCLNLLLSFFFFGMASAEKINGVTVSMQPAVPPSPGSIDVNVDAELDKCCGLGGGGNFQFSLRWSFNVDNGASILNGLQPVYPAPSPVHVLFQFHFDGAGLSSGNHSYSMFTEYVRFHLDGSGNIISEHVFGSNTTTGTFVIDTTPPVISISGVLNDQIYTNARTITFSATDPNLDSVTATLNGSPFQSGTTLNTDGPYTLMVTATDDFGNASNKSVDFRIWTALPPDPATIAPKIDPTVVTTLYSATRFIYTGDNPVQIGVEPGTIDPKRTVALRGRVLSRQGIPIVGTKITILGHNEYGATVSRNDGYFDLIVNGGTSLVVSYEHPDFITVQRSLQVAWEDWRVLEDVVLTPYDSISTVIDFSAPLQMARGNVMTDDDGARQNTLLFPQQVATMILPDGTEQQLSQLHVRATEYTVGSTGLQAMPAPLPPISAYTYAVELSVDEAVAAGATEVRFAVPVINYLENFLDIPVGIHMPVGYYDRQRGTWVGSDNGRVVEIISVTSGLADLDITGDGVADVDLARTELALPI